MKEGFVGMLDGAMDGRWVRWLLEKGHQEVSVGRGTLPEGDWDLQKAWRDTIAGRCRDHHPPRSDVSPSFATEAGSREQATIFYLYAQFLWSFKNTFFTGNSWLLCILFWHRFNLKFIPSFCPPAPFWLQIITWSDLINNAITVSPIPLTSRLEIDGISKF